MANVGIEVEVESRSVTQRDIQARIREGVLSTWELDTNEGSLRGGLLGWELRTTGQGVPFERVPSVLNELYPVLEDSTGVWRSAVHVHVDVRQQTNFQRALALALAYVADYDIFRQVSPEREESNFCVPLENKTSQVTRDIVRMAQGRQCAGYGKYSSVNILPMRSFGTMEFRHMRTPECDDSVPSIRAALTKIQHFVTLSHSIVTLGDYAPRPTSYSEVVEVFAMLAHNRFLWQAVGLTPRKEAALAVMLALGSVTDAPETEELPRLSLEDSEAQVAERVMRHAYGGARRGQQRRAITYADINNYFSTSSAQRNAEAVEAVISADASLWEERLIRPIRTHIEGGTE